MKQPGTSQRCFQSNGAGYELELDILPDARPDDSAATYSKALSYTSADLSNVVHSTPPTGTQADEYTGIAQANNASVGVDAVSFREGATVGLVFLVAGDGKAHSDAGEAIARAGPARPLSGLSVRAVWEHDVRRTIRGNDRFVRRAVRHRIERVVRDRPLHVPGLIRSLVRAGVVVVSRTEGIDGRR